MKQIAAKNIVFMAVIITSIGTCDFFCKNTDSVNTQKSKSCKDSIECQISDEVYICSCKPAMPHPNGDKSIAFQGKYFGSGIHANCDERYLLKFNLDSIPDQAIITHARLELYCLEMHGTSNGKMVYEPIIELWQSNSTTFNAKPAADTLNRILTGYPAAQQWHVIDLTLIVKGWIEAKRPNYGIMCYGTNMTSTASAIYSTSKNSRENIRPILKIWFEK